VTHEAGGKEQILKGGPDGDEAALPGEMAGSLSGGETIEELVEGAGKSRIAEISGLLQSLAIGRAKLPAEEILDGTRQRCRFRSFTRAAFDVECHNGLVPKQGNARAAAKFDGACCTGCRISARESVAALSEYIVRGTDSAH
jgi:hypothetical protein